MIEYIYDFLSIFFDKLKNKERIRNVVLFGSFARGNPRKDSDIDLFIDILDKDNEEISEIVKESLNEFELKSERTWRLKKITNPIVPIVGDINSEQWKELKTEISGYGISLYGKFSSEKKKSDKVLIEYNLSQLKQKNKMKIIREIFGYSEKKGKKIYEQKGMIGSLGGEKINNSVLVDKKNYKEFADFFRKNKVGIKVRS